MKYIYILLFNIGLLFGGCSDVLDKYPLDKPSQDNFFNNVSEISRGVNSCYRFLLEIADSGKPYPITLDLMSDIGFCRQDEDPKTIGKGEHDDKIYTVISVWADAYRGIARCNTMLEIIKEKATLLSDDQIKQFRGEVLFLRAFYYTRLVVFYGDVPLVLEPMLISEASNLTRTPKSEVISQIMADYTEAAGLLNVSYSNAADIGRATSGTVNAFKARAALYFGQYDVAATAAKAVIDSRVYELYPRYGDLFATKGLLDRNNKEIIFKKEYSTLINQVHSFPLHAATRCANGWATVVPTQNLVDSYHCIDGKNIEESTLFNKSKPFENRDPRLKLSIVVPGDRFGDYRFESHVDSAECFNYVTGLWEMNRDCYTYTPYTSYTGYNIRKFAGEDYITKNTKADYPLILCRYAEVLLTYAEAKIELNQIDQSVVDAINEIRNKRDDVKMPAYSLSDFLDQNQARLKIRHERKIELAFEGFRYTDLRRWHWAEIYANKPVMGRPFKGATTDWPDVSFDANGEPTYDYENYEPHPSSDYRIVEYRTFIKGKHELWPIPERERNLNPNLIQNPGY